MSSSESIFAKLFASLFKSNDPEAEKKRRIKAIAKVLSKSKYHFYKNDEVLPGFAKLFYDMYKAVFPAKAMFMSQENPNQLKYMVVSHCLNDEQHAVIATLDEEAIKSQAAKLNIEQLTEEVKKNINSFTTIFSAEKVQQIESLYRQLMMFKGFCTYDFYYLLKKFDSSIHEGEFNSIPQFDKINSEYITDDLKDFIAVAWVLPAKDDWSPMIKFFKDTRGTEPITLNLWNKIIARLNNIKLSRTFEMMIQVISKNPEYEPDFFFQDTPIVDTYMDKIRGDAEKTLRAIAQQQQNNKVDGLLQQIFGTTQVERLTNYTVQNSAQFERKTVGAFTYSQALNYYKAFLLDFVKKDIREFSDLVLIRGTWANQALSTPMSNAYHALLASSDALLAFDAKIAEDKEIGIKLKTLMPRTERDKEARNIMGTIIGDLNNEAKELCVDGTKNLITIGKTIKLLLEDYAKPKGEVVINWKELDKSADHPIKELGVSAYKHIYLFVNLMQSTIQ